MALPGKSRGGGPAIIIAPTMPSSAAELNALLLAKAGPRGVTEGGVTHELPAGTLNVETTINIPNHVELVGQGAGTVLKATGAMAGIMIKNGHAGDRRFSVKNLTIYGNDRPVTGISFDTPSTAGQEYIDGMWRIEDVMLKNCGLNGIEVAGRGDGRIAKVDIRDTGGIGLRVLGPDNSISEVMIGGTGNAGIEVADSNNRFSMCKAYYNGLTNNVTGHAWWVHDCILVNFNTCEGQDAANHGWYFNEVYNWTGTGLIADSNGSGRSSAGAAEGNGFHFNGADGFQMTGHSRDRNANPTRQQYALGFSGWYGDFDISISSFGNQGPLHEGHFVNLNNRNGLTARINGVSTSLNT